MFQCKTFTIDEILATDGDLFKFVKVGGEYRFCSLFDNHSQLVLKGETGTSAGLFMRWPDYLRMEDTYSNTLRIGCGKEAYVELGALFKIPVINKWDC